MRATAKRTYGSCSHFFSASIDFVLRAKCFIFFFVKKNKKNNVPGRDADSIASAHSRPEAGHSCMALAKSLSAISFDEIRFSS